MYESGAVGCCKAEGCTQIAYSSGACVAHGGGQRCQVPGCSSGAQSRGLCKRHGGGVRCAIEGCSKSAQDNGFCRMHGEGYKCKHSGGCMNWAQMNGMCVKHVAIQDDGGGAEEEVALGKETTGAASGDRLNAAEDESTGTSANSTAATCSVELCTAVAEKKGLCRLHSVKTRCSYLKGCRSWAHANGMCLTHMNVSPPPHIAQHSILSNGVSAIPESGLPSRHTVQTQLNARQQELQARQYCEAALSVRSTELLAILEHYATDGLDQDESSESDNLWNATPTQTTANYHQRIAEQYCNGALAARGLPITQHKASRQFEECNIRGCRNLSSGRPLCPAHEAWATGMKAN